MALNPAGQLAAAQLAIYGVLILPSLYSLLTHRLPGVSGFGFLFAFCALRIVGSALQISNEKHKSTSDTAQIISGVGLSPLVLAFVGVLHESNHYSRGTTPFVLSVIPMLVLHLIVGAAIALVVVGYQPDQKDGRTLQRVGYIFFVLLWVAVATLTAISWRVRRESKSSKRLLYACTAALPFLGVRMLYSLIAAFDTSINAFLGPIAYRVCLATLMELCIVIILCGAGIWTRHVYAENRALNRERRGRRRDVEATTSGGEVRKRWLDARRG